tara:strand:+ start:229 stop:726 length:498 start_codon:yes stop_codon:yes gene_type:complete
MKKIILILLVALGLQTQAQINYCDSISYTTSSTINYPLTITGITNIPGTVTWSWQVCNANMCYSGSGINASFGQVSLTDTLKVCYDVIIDINGMTYTCSKCDSLVYNQNSYQWEAISAQPLGIAELKPNLVDDGKRYDLLGREIFEIHNRRIYIKNGKKYITNGR